MQALAKPPKPQSIAKHAQKPTGPRFIPKIEEVISGYGEVPNGFLTGQNSLTEWIAYWALAKIFNNPKGDDVRQPPFFGGWPDWGYQVSLLGNHTRAIGSTVADFVIYQGGTQLAIYIDTEHFHIFTDSRKQASDALQRAQVAGTGVYPIAIYDTELLGDPSGQRAIVAMKRAIGRLEKLNPVISRSAIRASHLKVLN